ncbi:NBS-LRR resistance-like protein [Artemisia annua]|uniref:NBS-LRR resistance-like protein n=1 Tax=Artemisia annua TaxID=35608 RepID=A0A2U1L6Q7_ARTAN|nr:NBS-LRR resistance-like protein [Artemisia annua]
MAEVIASTLIEAVLQKLVSEAVKQVGRVQGIRSELMSLEKTLFHIKALLVDASDKEIKEVLVQNWLNELKHLAYDIDDILDDLATEAMHREFTDQSGGSTSMVRKLIPSCCTNFSLSTKMRRKLDNINLKLQGLENEKTTIGLTVKNGGLEVGNNRPIDRNRVLETSLVDASSIVGRQGDKDELIEKLLGDDPRNKNFSIVPIVGMGGVGKTTLARILYNEKKVNAHFQLKVWICVSQEWDSFQISKSIFQSVSGEDIDKKLENNFNLLQEALMDKLREKQFLLVLDDVWTESYKDWETLVRPFSVCARGSKVIITTRKEKLLKELGCSQLNQLQCLSHDDALSLFCQHALDANNFDLYPTLKAHGEGIVRKCKGLPLALIALGKLLRTKEDEEGWKDMVDSEIWSIEEGGGIIPALKLSYHELPASLKQLFAYCSLFPKDYLFEKDELVLLWMAEGFLRQSDRSKSTEERLGDDYFAELLSRSFSRHAPDNGSRFVMHDLMHDLATSVAGEFFFRLEKEMIKDVRKLALEKLRHMSFVCEEYEAYKKFEGIERAKSLRTLLSVGVKHKQDYYLSTNVLVNLFPELHFLRVLSLSGYEISEVPESIGKLKHLRYLNLSQTNITHFPKNVCDLYNLETLILFGCSSLIKLPNNFIKLKNLRHLDIRDTPLLKDLPLGIGELKSLQTLSKIIIGGANDFLIIQLKDFENLHGKVSIEGLEKVKNATEAREANLSQKRLTEFQVEWSGASRITPMETTENAILDALKPYNDCLEKLGIVNYMGLEFPKWVGDPSFRQLARVSIRGCKKCASLPPLGQLPSLKELSIQDMDDVNVVRSEFFGTGLAFPSLESLSFGNMSGWKAWSTDSRSGVGDSVFPCLQELRIEGCPNLVEFSFEGDSVFPCLQELHIEGCPNLVEVSLKAPLLSLRGLRINNCGDGLMKSLVRVAPSVTKLEIESISGLTNEVWRGVILGLKAVEELIVKKCDEIRYLRESKEAEASSKVLVNLRKLEVRECKNLVSLGEKDEEYNSGSNLLTSLSLLEVMRCDNFKHLSCPNNIEKLIIVECNSITCVSFFSMEGGQKLKSVFISSCKKLMIKEELGEGEDKNRLLINSKSMPMLETVYISHLNVASIIDFGGNFIHLTTLEISYDESTESSFQDLQLPSLTSLTTLVISDCPSMNVPTAGLWHPNLRELRIGGLKKPISEWGPQKLPSTLVDLTLSGEAASNWSELSHLHLPSSLTRLSIIHFQNLERVSDGLQHLTSLQHLSFFGCPKSSYRGLNHRVEELYITRLSTNLGAASSYCPASISESKEVIVCSWCFHWQFVGGIELVYHLVEASES